jgi:hypothetical protein
MRAIDGKKNTSLKLKQTVENFFVFMIMHTNVTGIITIIMIMQRAVILNTLSMASPLHVEDEAGWVAEDVLDISKDKTVFPFGWNLNTVSRSF